MKHENLMNGRKLVIPGTGTVSGDLAIKNGRIAFTRARYYMATVSLLIIRIYTIVFRKFL